MRQRPHYDSAAVWYAAILKNARKGKLPPGYPQPQPPEQWPAENVALLEKYLEWLYADNAGPSSIHHFYLPTAGHVLGYHLEHHKTLDLEAGLARVMDYFQAKQLGDRWLAMGQHALNRFRRFMHEERGYARLPKPRCKPERIKRYHQGLPAWLIEQLQQYYQIRQANWRPSREPVASICFWRSHTELWRWLFAQDSGHQLDEITRSRLFAFMDERLEGGYNVRSINLELKAFQATLRFLQEREFVVPQQLFRHIGLREPNTLPRFLTDEQVSRLQAEIEATVERATTPARKRNALMDRAFLYLLWQAGLRTAEIEDLDMADLNLAGRQLIVRRGKGQKDRTVYLTEITIEALRDYLAQRGSSQSDRVFTYRHEPLGHQLVRNRIKAAGKRAGVKVTPHQLRHTFATQLVNAGAKVTTIQALLGHKRLDTTLVYTQVHNETVAEDYFSAMSQVEGKLEEQLPPLELAESGDDNGEDVQVKEQLAHLLTLAATLEAGLLGERQQSLVQALKEGLAKLADPTGQHEDLQIVNEQSFFTTGQEVVEP